MVDQIGPSSLDGLLVMAAFFSEFSEATIPSKRWAIVSGGLAYDLDLARSTIEELIKSFASLGTLPTGPGNNFLISGRALRVG